MDSRTAQGLSDAAWRWLADRLGMPALLATPARTGADIALPPSRLNEAARTRLVALVGADQLRDDAGSRLAHAGRGLIAMLRHRAGDATLVPDAVLQPRTEAEAAAALRACAEMDIAVHAQAGRAHVDFDLSHMMRLNIDAMSGLADVEAGVSSSELAARLAARGLALETAVFGSLGDFISGQTGIDWLHSARLATPLGLAEGLGALASGSRGAFGLITSATLRVRPAVPQTTHGYIFPDFAAGLAVLQQAARGGIAHGPAALQDGTATHFARGLARVNRPFDLKARLRDILLEMRRFDDRASSLTIAFATARARKAFDVLVRRAGGMALRTAIAAPDLSLLMARGVNSDSFTGNLRWSKLPGAYAAARHALDHAMRTASPLPGAHGVVLATVHPSRADSAVLRLDVVYPRKLDAAVAQALSIQSAGRAALESADDAATATVHRAIKQALDPKNILPPL